MRVNSSQPMDGSRVYPALLTFILALTVYLLTMPSGLTFAHYGADGGDLITASVTLGTPHPPGYPLYVLLGKAFSLLPVGSIAYRFNLLSALSMAAASALIASVTMRITRPVSAVSAALMFAFAPLVWGQAIIAEVYALNALLLAITLWLLTHDQQRPFWVGLFLSLSVTTHLTSALLLPLVLWHVAPRHWLRLAVGGVLGLLPLALLPIFALGSSPVVWGDATSLTGWFWLVSGAVYRPNVFSHPIMPRLAAAVVGALRQFSLVGWVLLVLGLFRPKTPNPATPHAPHPALFLGTAVVYALYALTYDAVDAVVNTIPALLLCAIVLAPSLDSIKIGALLLPLLAVALNFSAINLHNDVSVERLINQALEPLPDSAVALTAGDDQTLFALWYARYATNMRPDIIIVDRNLLAFDWYRQRLSTLNPTLQALTVDNVDNFIAENRQFRPICTVSLQRPQENQCFTKDQP